MYLKTHCEHVELNEEMCRGGGYGGGGVVVGMVVYLYG